MSIITTLPTVNDMIVELAQLDVDSLNLQKIVTEATVLPIDPAHDDMDDIIQQMKQVTGYLEASKKGLALVSSIKSPNDREKHTVQLMTNMSRIRQKHKRIERMFDEWWENHRAGSVRRSTPSSELEQQHNDQGTS